MQFKGEKRNGKPYEPSLVVGVYRRSRRRVSRRLRPSALRTGRIHRRRLHHGRPLRRVGQEPVERDRLSGHRAESRHLPARRRGKRARRPHHRQRLRPALGGDLLLFVERGHLDCRTRSENGASRTEEAAGSHEGDSRKANARINNARRGKLAGFIFCKVVTMAAVDVLSLMKGVCNRMSKEAGKREIIYQMTMRTAWKMVQKEEGFELLVG